MRFELYSYYHLFDNTCFFFETESEKLEELLIYIIQHQQESTAKCWLYIDNSPSTFDYRAYGYTQKPSEDDCYNRILHCKYAKETHLLNEKTATCSFAVFSEKEHTVCFRIAEQKSRLLCTSLFTLPCG